MLIRHKLGDYRLMQFKEGWTGSIDSKDCLYQFPRVVSPRISPQTIIEQVLES